MSRIIYDRKQDHVDELLSPDGRVVKRITKHENGISVLEEFSPNGELFARTKFLKGKPLSYRIVPQANGFFKEIDFGPDGNPTRVREINDVLEELYFDEMENLSSLDCIN